MHIVIRNMLLAAMALAAPLCAGAEGQNARRLVLCEEFTNVGCGPCARFAPALDGMLKKRLGDVVAIKYHYNFPDASDPYYLNEPEDVKARASYYGIEGVPTVFFDGNRGTTSGDYLDNYVDILSGKKQTVDLQVKASLKDHHLAVEAAVTPLEDIPSGDIRTFVAVVEEWKVFDKAFSNGEREFFYVMQKMLPDGRGFKLDGGLTKGRTFNVPVSWDVKHFYDETQLGIVTFVQNMTTKEVLATVYTPYPTGSDDAARVLDVYGTPDNICSPAFSGSVVIRNTGRDTLRSASINVSINGAVQHMPWTGSLGYLAVDTVETQNFTDFRLAEKNNDVKVWLSDINGTAEESAGWKVGMTTAPKALNGVRLSIMTDRKPEETTWKLLNSAGDVIDEGGPYSEPRHKYTKMLPIAADDCYMLEFYDSGKDGINGSNGAGYYKIDQVTSDGKSRMLSQATYDTAYHAAFFSVENADGALSVDRMAASGEGSVSLYTAGGVYVCTATASSLRDIVRRKSLKGIFIVRSAGTHQTHKLIIE